LGLCSGGLAGERSGAGIGMEKLAMSKETSVAEETNGVCPSG
jgi:hypothetical protein